MSLVALAAKSDLVQDKDGSLVVLINDITKKQWDKIQEWSEPVWRKFLEDVALHREQFLQALKNHRITIVTAMYGVTPSLAHITYD